MKSVSFSKWQLIMKGRGGEGRDDTGSQSLRLEREWFRDQKQEERRVIRLNSIQTL